MFLKYINSEHLDSWGHLAVCLYVRVSMCPGLSVYCVSIIPIFEGLTDFPEVTYGSYDIRSHLQPIVSVYNATINNMVSQSVHTVVVMCTKCC
jgi:hypothetical protein